MNIWISNCMFSPWSAKQSLNIFSNWGLFFQTQINSATLEVLKLQIFCILIHILCKQCFYIDKYLILHYTICLNTQHENNILENYSIQVLEVFFMIFFIIISSSLIYICYMLAIAGPKRLKLVERTHRCLGLVKSTFFKNQKEFFFTL